MQRATDALLIDNVAPPFAVLRRIRELVSELEGERREIEPIEHHLAAASSTGVRAAAEAWRGLVDGVETFDFDMWMLARKLVADTFSRIVVYPSGFDPESNDGSIDLILIAKRDSKRILRVDRRTGEWRSTEELNHFDKQNSDPPRPGR